MYAWFILIPIENVYKFTENDQTNNLPAICSKVLKWNEFTNYFHLKIFLKSRIFYYNKEQNFFISITFSVASRILTNISKSIKYIKDTSTNLNISYFVIIIKITSKYPKSKSKFSKLQKFVENTQKSTYTACLWKCS